MAATPLKPWERSGSETVTPRMSTRPAANDGSSPPPSVPPRASAQPAVGSGYGTTYSPYTASRHYGPGGYGGTYGSGYGGTYGGGYGGTYGGDYGGTYGGGYGGTYGGDYGRPMGMYGGGYGFGGGEGDSQFVRQAEEGTRAAFQSVESVVGAFSSISMMLESTYFAVHSCFRAVLGVAQHFSRLRDHIWAIVSAVALLRRLRQWLRYLLRLLRLRSNTDRDDAWEEVSIQQNSALRLAEISHTAPSANDRVWPAVIFFAVAVGVPWLLWRVMSSLVKSEESAGPESNQLWAGGDGQQPVCARALYDFHSQQSDELSFSTGDELVLAPRQLQTGWLLAGRNRSSGFVPANYVEVLPLSAAKDDIRRNSHELRHEEESLLND